MADLTREDVLKLARLSRLQLSDQEVDRFQKEIDAILHYVEQLPAVRPDDQPTFQVTGLTNVTRPDEVVDYGVSPEALLKNAPQTENNQIKVRRML